MNIPYNGIIYKSVAELCRENNWDVDDFRRFQRKNRKVPIEQLAERYAKYRETQLTLDDRYWPTLKKACDELGWDYKEVQNWKQRYHKTDKKTLLSDYRDYLKERLIPVFGKYYKSVSAACRDNDVNYVPFMQYRQTESMEETVEEQIIAFKNKEPKSNPFPFEGKIYKTYTEVCSNEGWNERDFTIWRHTNKEILKGLSRKEKCCRYKTYLASDDAKKTKELVYTEVSRVKGWDDKDFSKFRRKNRKSLIGLSKQEKCDQYEAHLASRNAKNINPFPPPLKR